jgi:phosphatidylserine/phosphatidylglycerophosphate/cardiolipin synthase-like enzyme
LVEVYCKELNDNELLFERIFRKLLFTAFESKKLYIISPWLSIFNFKLKFVYYPYVSSTSVEDVLKAIIDSGVRIYMFTRCFDFLDLELIGIAYRGVVSKSMLSYIKGSLSDMIERAETLLRLANLKDLSIKFDLDNRLHSKVYVNDHMAILGSANFTYSGLYRNIECIAVVGRDETIHQVLRKYAETLSGGFRGFPECENYVLNSLKSIAGIRLGSLKELLELLKELRAKL